MRLPLPKWTLTPASTPAVEYSGVGFLWRDFGSGGVYWYMASWNSYYYCKMCDRPLSSQDYGTQGNYTAAGNTKTVYCRFCAATAEGPGKSRIIAGLVLITIATPLIYLLVGNEPLALGIPAPAITILLGAFYIATHFRDKSTYSPIYDRWVMEHGTDHQKWPGASKFE